MSNWEDVDIEKTTLLQALIDRFTRPRITTRDLICAQGKAMALLVGLLQRDGRIRLDEFGGHLAVLSVVTGETSPAQGEILAAWSAIIQQLSDAEPRSRL